MMKPQVISFCPYPHERKIHLQKHESNTKYFYTSIDTKTDDERAFYLHLMKKLGLKQSWITNRLHHNEKQDSFVSIICMDMTNYQYDVYSQIGDKMNTVKFDEIVLKYGEPMSTSSNGQHFVFGP